MKKRVIGFLLAVVMLLTIMPQLTPEAKAHKIVMTAEEFVDCLWTAYYRPNKYRNQFPYNLGYYDGSVIYFDCWNLGKAIIWSKGAIVNNYTVGHYASMDSSCGLGDWDGYSIIKAAPNCSTSFDNLVPGEWLYMNNHTGYYVGNGQVIECTAGWNAWRIVVSQIDQYGNRSMGGVANGRWVYRGMVPWLDYTDDEEKPVISDVQYSEVSSAGYTVTCKVTDNSSVKRVAFPTWTVHNGQDDLPAQFMSTQQGTKNGDTYTFRVNASAHNNETGDYVTHIYAEDVAGNVTSLPLSTVQVRDDNQNPVISDVVFSEVSAAGYTVSCTVTDDWGVHSVSFPTWTVHNGQDDLPAQFLKTQLGTRNGNRYTFRVNASAHNNETGAYVTHIYATDCAGNRVSLPLNTVQVMNDTENPVVSDITVSNISAQGYTVSCKVTDNWGIHKVAFPTWTVNNGQDDLPEDFLNTQLGQRSGDIFTFYVRTSDHNNELGAYVTHIYAVDCAGNEISVPVDAVNVRDFNEEITLVSSSDYAMENGYILHVKPQTTVQSLLTQFENENLVVQDPSGNAIGSSAVVGTGATVNLYNGDLVVQRVTVVILGDVDGNGIVDATDYLRIKAAALGKLALNEAENLAADIDKDDIIAPNDYAKVKEYFLGTFNLYG
jgi:ribosomal protein L23